MTSMTSLKPWAGFSAVPFRGYFGKHGPRLGGSQSREPDSHRIDALVGAALEAQPYPVVAQFRPGHMTGKRQP